MDETKNIQKMYEFLTTLKERFTNENITAIDLKFYHINPKDEFLQLWLKQNKEYEIIGNSIYKSTADDKIRSLEIQINRNIQRQKDLDITFKSLYLEKQELTNQLINLKKMQSEIILVKNE